MKTMYNFYFDTLWKKYKPPTPNWKRCVSLITPRLLCVLENNNNVCIEIINTGAIST